MSSEESVKMEREEEPKISTEEKKVEKQQAKEQGTETQKNEQPKAESPKTEPKKAAPLKKEPAPAKESIKSSKESVTAVEINRPATRRTQPSSKCSCNKPSSYVYIIILCIAMVNLLYVLSNTSS